MERISATPSLALEAEATSAPLVWLPAWAVGCCTGLQPTVMWMIQVSQQQQLQAAYQRGLEEGRREAAQAHAAALRTMSSN